MTTAVGAIRLSGEGWSSERQTAIDPAERTALVDQRLDRLASSPDGGVVILEIDRHRDEFARVDAFRQGEAAPDDLVVEILRIGIHGSVGAAEYLRRPARPRPRPEEYTIYATHNPSPSDSMPVLYDSCVPFYLEAGTVVSIDVVKQLAHEYALHGSWPDDVPKQEHHDLVAKTRSST